MTELKTLKDMRADSLLEKAFKVRLRTEAVKWVKWKLTNSNVLIREIKRHGLSIVWNKKDLQQEDDYYSAGFILAMVGFFNITEADLQEEK